MDTTGGYWFKVCPFCQAGRLFIMHDAKHDRLTLTCEECLYDYLDPNRTRSFSDATFKVDNSPPWPSLADMTTIVAYGWKDFAKEQELPPK